MKKFWYIWNLEGQPPRYRHYSEGDAVLEADRLARDNPGQYFIVLEAKTAFVKEDVRRIDLLEECPRPS